MLGQHGFLAHVFSVFNKFAASVDVIATSEVTVSLTLDEGRVPGRVFMFSCEQSCDVAHLPQTETYQSLSAMMRWCLV